MKIGAVVRIHAVFEAEVSFMPVAITQKWRKTIPAAMTSFGFERDRPGSLMPLASMMISQGETGQQEAGGDHFDRFKLSQHDLDRDI